MVKLATDAVLKRLLAYGLALPGAHAKSPWPGHNDLAVADKTFAYLSVPGEPFSIGCKLPASRHVALMLPFATPTHYGLGKSGWVTALWPPNKPIDEAMLEAWILESYRAQAPKKLVKELDGAAAAKPAPRRRKR